MIQGRTPVKRRDWLLHSGLFILGTSSPAFASPKGAAELDAGFYLKNIFNDKTLSTPKFQDQLPSRPVNASFAKKLEAKCLQNIATASGLSLSSLNKRYAENIAKLGSSFGAPAAFIPGDLGESRALNFAIFCWWRLAIETIPNDDVRRQFAVSLGDDLLRELQPELFNGAIRLEPVGISSLIRDTTSLLNTLRDIGFITSFELKIPEDAQEDWDNSYPVELQVSLVNSVSVEASLRLANEDRRFRPDIAQLLFSSLFRRRLLEVGFDEYFIDEAYKEDPRDWRPSTLIQQWELQPPATSS